MTLRGGNIIQHLRVAVPGAGRPFRQSRWYSYPCAVIQLLYLSTEAQPFDVPQLRALLKQSREANAARGVSGMLLYRSGFFLQVLEGEPGQVRPLVARIAKDTRHKAFVVLDEKAVEQRDFGAWSMGFRDISEARVEDLPGFHDLARDRATFQGFASNPSIAKQMLLSFRNQGVQGALAPDEL